MMSEFIEQSRRGTEETEAHSSREDTDSIRKRIKYIFSVKFTYAL